MLKSILLWVPTILAQSVLNLPEYQAGGSLALSCGDSKKLYRSKFQKQYTNMSTDQMIPVETVDSCCASSATHASLLGDLRPSKGVQAFFSRIANYHRHESSPADFKKAMDNLQNIALQQKIGFAGLAIAPTDAVVYGFDQNMEAQQGVTISHEWAQGADSATDHKVYDAQGL